MDGTLQTVLPPILGLSAVLYLALAVFVSRSSPRNIIGFFLLLIGTLIAGTAFSYGTQDPHMYGIGRVLSLFASGFLPVTFYAIYREYTLRRSGHFLMAVLSIIPIITCLLAASNSLHNIIWVGHFSETGWQFSNAADHFWIYRVHAPFAYCLFGLSAIALLSRLPTIAPAHRRNVVILLIGVVIPYLTGIANTVLGIGNPQFPALAVSLAFFLPLYGYASLSLRVYEFSPLAYQTLFDHVRDPIIVLDNQQRIVCANRRAEEMLNKTESELLGQKLWEDFPEARAILDQAKDLDLTQTLKMDTNRTYELSVAPLTGARGDHQGLVVVCRDVTERRRALSQLADSEHLIRTLIETSSNGILRFARDDSDGRSRFRCIFANRAAESYLTDGNSALVGMPLEKLSQIEPELLSNHFDDTDKSGDSVSFETRIENPGGQGWLRVIGEPVGDDFSVTVVDITQRKRNEHKMLEDALRDPLTGVLNRRGFEKEAATGIRNTDRGAVLYLDLNHFKSINDRFGHQAGDALLKAFGHRLEFCLRPEDVLGRLGGDEFAIVLPGVSVEDAKHIAERLVITASEAYIIQGEEIKCAASVGISLMPQHGEELWHLISVADQAMYKSKSYDAEEAANDRAAYVEAAIAS